MAQPRAGWSVTALGTIVGSRSFFSNAVAISDDGRVVAGTASTAVPGAWALYRWTRGGGMVPLSADPAIDFRPAAVNADGRIIVGTYYERTPASGSNGFIWTREQGLVLYPPSTPDNPVDTRYLADVSSDGSVLVGSQNGLAARWTLAGVDLIPVCFEEYGCPPTAARCVSGDGNTVGGIVVTTDGAQGGFLWSATDGLLRSWETAATVVGISRDGATFVSHRERDFGFYGPIWYHDGMEVPLTPVGEFWCSVTAMSGDGRTVSLYQLDTTAEHRALIWTPDAGFRSLWAMLVEAGVDLSHWQDASSFVVSGLSFDGRVAVGSAINATGQHEGFVAELGVPCPADLDDGSGTGTPDGGVTVDDLIYYLSLYIQGHPRADVDDGTLSGTPDGGVTIDDLLYFLVRYAAGC